MGNSIWEETFGKFQETSKQIYRKLQYREKLFGKFQGMSCFPKKLVLSSLRKFSILKPCTNIQLLRGFDLGFWYFRTNL